MNSSILLIEDRKGLRQVYSDFLKRNGYQVVEAGSVEDAVKVMDSREFHLILTDYMLPGQNGMDFLKTLREKEPDYPIIIMTAFGEVKLAVEAMKLGAFDFLEKPVDLDYLLLVVERALDNRRLLLSLSYQESRAKSQKVQIIGDAPKLTQALALAEKVAPSDTNCLLLGESGVGKELFAQLVHEKSHRAKGAMVSINCASIPHELIESELFGHEKGAFTGAIAKKVGLVEVANGGTIFLDELGEMPIDLQPKLLRVIQSKEFFRVGGNKVLKSDIRVVCATNRDLKAGTREGWFREDLYYRLAVFPIEIPPLRDRKGDLPTLCQWFLKKKGAPEIAPEVLQAIQNYDWPGNVRELENVLERAVILSQGGRLELSYFPEELFRGKDAVSLNFQIQMNRSFRDNLDMVEEQFEQRFIALILQEVKGNREKAAKRLGISVKTLYNKIKFYNIQL